MSNQGTIAMCFSSDPQENQRLAMEFVRSDEFMQKQQVTSLGNKYDSHIQGLVSLLKQKVQGETDNLQKKRLQQCLDALQTPMLTFYEFNSYVAPDFPSPVIHGYAYKADGKPCVGLSRQMLEKLKARGGQSGVLEYLFHEVSELSGCSHKDLRELQKALFSDNYRINHNESTVPQKYADYNYIKQAVRSIHGDEIRRHQERAKPIVLTNNVRYELQKRLSALCPSLPIVNFSDGDLMCLESLYQQMSLLFADLDEQHVGILLAKLWAATRFHNQYGSQTLSDVFSTIIRNFNNVDLDKSILALVFESLFIYFDSKSDGMATLQELTLDSAMRAGMSIDEYRRVFSSVRRKNKSDNRNPSICLAVADLTDIPAETRESLHDGEYSNIFEIMDILPGRLVHLASGYQSDTFPPECGRIPNIIDQECSRLCDVKIDAHNRKDQAGLNAAWRQIREFCKEHAWARRYMKCFDKLVFAKDPEGYKNSMINAGLKP